jgi:hypothetical protein
LNVTAPVGVPVLPVELSATVAENITDAPALDGLAEEISVVVVVAWFTTSDVVVSVKPLTLAFPLYAYEIGYVPGASVEILMFTGPNVPEFPLKLATTEGRPCTVMVTVSGLVARPPSSSTIMVAFGGRLTVAVPKGTTAGGVIGVLKLAVALLTVSVKGWLAGVPTPLVAVIVMGKLPTVPSAGVPLSTPADDSVMPLGNEPVSLNVGAGNPVAATVNVPAVFTVKAVLLTLVIIGAWPTVSVKD